MNEKNFESQLRQHRTRKDSTHSFTRIQDTSLIGTDLRFRQSLVAKDSNNMLYNNFEKHFQLKFQKLQSEKDLQIASLIKQIEGLRMNYNKINELMQRNSNSKKKYTLIDPITNNKDYVEQEIDSMVTENYTNKVTEIQHTLLRESSSIKQH